MAIRSWMLVGALALGVVACASIIKLDDSDPANAGISSEGGGSSGATLGDGGITTEAGVSVSTGSVQFARSNCGIAQTQPINVTNGSSEPKGVDISLPADDKVFSLDGATNGSLHLNLAAGATGSFSVTAKNDTATVATADVLVKVGDEEHHVSVSLETAGGLLSFEPTSLNFGFVRPDKESDPQKVVFRNDGTDPITLNGFTGLSAFKVTAGLPATVAPGATGEVTLVMNSAPEGNPVTETLQPEASALCGAAPTLVLQGQHLNAEFTINPLSTVDFGDVNCGAGAPGAKTITISNYTGAKPFTVALGKNPSPFTVTPLTGNLDGGSAGSPKTATITVTLPTPPQIPQDLTDTLTITVDNKPPTSIPLKARIRGALLTVSAPRLTVSHNSNSTGKVTLTNSGNVSACVQYVRSNNTYVSEDYTCYCCGYGCEIKDDGDTVNAGSSTDWSVRYLSGSSSTTITAKVVRCGGYPSGGSTAPLCGTAPSITVDD